MQLLPILVNDYRLSTVDEKADLAEQIYAHYSSKE